MVPPVAKRYALRKALYARNLSLSRSQARLSVAKNVLGVRLGRFEPSAQPKPKAKGIGQTLKGFFAPKVPKLSKTIPDSKDRAKFFTRGNY